MKKKLAAIILAAGKGTRLKSNLAKALHTVCGETLLEISLKKAVRLFPNKIAIIVGFQKEKVIGSLKKYKGIITVEQKKLLGTADAIRSTKDILKNFSGDTLIIYVDMPLIKKETLKALIDYHRKNLNDCTVLTAKVQNPKGFGRIIRNASGEILSIVEDKDLSAEQKNLDEINTGIMCFKNDVLFKFIDEIKLNQKKKEFYLTDIIDLLYRSNLKLGGFVLEDDNEVFGINSRRDLSCAQEARRLEIIYRFIDNGLDIKSPQTTFIDEDVLIGKGTIIYPFTVIEKDVRIGRNCKLGPFCHLRPGTRLKPGVCIGNFTEINRSSIDINTLVKHFSYLGDTNIGRNVNIGAGTVTANYDGVNKNKTLIGDGAFIGSDSILVAPVKVGKKAVTGAGCVVTKDVKDKQVVIGVPARRIK
ncbi:MAG: sugar phosphate nucleotidyltransferase [Candidatus Omnitrophota bacterium]